MEPPSTGLRVHVPGAIDTNDSWASEPPSPPVSPGGRRANRRGARTLTITGKKNLSQGVCGNVWVHNDDAWKLIHQFSTGLELDSETAGAKEGLPEAPRAQLHLPSTSLMVLEQLQACLRNRRCVEMDVHLEDTNRDNDLSDVLLRLVESQASLTAAARTEVRNKLTQRRQPPTPGSSSSKAGGEEQINHLAPSQLIEPAAGQEAIDVAICPVSGLEASTFADGNKLALGLVKLASTLDMDGATSRVSVKYAALIICPQADALAYQEAHQLACTVAATFMDENFAGTVRSLPREQPEGLVAALDEYLSSITIVPTVYLARKQQNDAEGVAEQIAYYLLAESLVQSMEKKLCRQRGLTFSSFDLHGALRARERMNRRQFFLQVSKFLPLEDDWTVTHRLRQGLEVESNLHDARPQMPSVSVSALTQVRQLMTPSSVALNICCGGAEQATKVIVEQLGKAGLPPNALEDVSHALNTVSTKNSIRDSRTSAFELLEPSQGDEACHVFVVPSVQLPAHNGFMGAFFRFSPALGFPFAPLDLPIRFLFVLVGPQSSEAELLSLGHSLAVLSTDEDLMSGLTQVGDNSAFVNAIDMRLGNLTFIPHAYLTTKGAVSPSSAGSWDSRPTEDLQSHARAEEEMTEPLSPKTNRSVKSGRSKGSGSDSDNPSPPKVKRSNSFGSSSSGQTTISAALIAMGGAHKKQEGKWNFRRCMRATIAKLQKYSVPLCVGVTTALVWSNIDEHSYHSFTHGQVSNWELVGHEVSLHFIVNDIFMCFFFGLAIKEVAEAVLPGGSLSPIRRAANPLLATVGGVVGPVATYYVMVSIMQAAGSFEDTLCDVAVSGSGDHRRLGGGGGSSASSGPTVKEVCSLGTLLKGWGVPTATDISLAWMFALLVFGAGHPAINVLLLLAIVDDALGMVIIAIFYPNPEKPVEPLWLLLVLLSMVLSLVLRKLRCDYWHGWVLIPGPVSWLGLIKAHVHPALALVFVVPFMPAMKSRRRGKSVRESPDGRHNRVSKAVAKVVDMLDTTGGTSSRTSGDGHGKEEDERSAAVQRAAEAIIHHSQAPLHAFEHSLKLPVDLGMFFFGLANAGVQLGAVGGITWSVLGALLVGKTLGIAGFGMLAMSMGFSLPTGVTIVDLFAMSALGGIGLTVALFVANEAFVDPGLQAQAKMGAVLSVGCAFFAWLIKFVGNKCIKQPDDEETTVFITDATIDGEDEEMGDMDAGEWLDDFLVEDIMQIMWTHRQYRLRGMKMPMNRASIRAASKEAGGHRRLSGRMEGGRTSSSSLDLGSVMGLRKTSSTNIQDIPDQPRTKDGLGPYNSEDSTDPRNFKGSTDGQLNGDAALSRQTSPATSVGGSTKISGHNTRVENIA